MECTLYLSDSCNMECSYCYQIKKDNGVNLSEDNLKTAIEYIIKNNLDGDKIDLLFLGGEPLLNKEMMYRALEIINSDYQNYKDLFSYKITTNGTLINHEDIKFFKDNDFEVSLSIDGDQFTNNLNRKISLGNNAYETVMKNIEEILYQELNFSIRMTVTSNNVGSLYENISRFYKMGVSSINIGVDKIGKWEEIDIRNFDEQLDLLDDLYLDYVIKNKGYKLNLYDAKLPSIMVKQSPMYCSAGTRGHIVINSTGELYPCGYVVNLEEWNIGNIKEGLNEEKFFKTVKERVQSTSSCKDCDIAYTCDGARCGFMNYVMTGKLNRHKNTTCLLERIVYKHTILVMERLLIDKNERTIFMMNKIKEFDLDLTDIMKKLIDENGGMDKYEKQ